MSYIEGTAFRDKNIITISKVKGKKAQKNNTEVKIKPICANPNCDVVLTQGRSLCPTCANVAFKEFWLLLPYKGLNTVFINQEFRNKEEWNGDIFAVLNFARLKFKDAKSIHNEEEMKQWETVLEIIHDSIFKIETAKGN